MAQELSKAQAAIQRTRFILREVISTGQMDAVTASKIRDAIEAVRDADTQLNIYRGPDHWKPQDKDWGVILE